MSWPLAALGDLGKIVTGSTPKTSEDGNFGGTIPFITPSDLGQTEALISTPRSLTDGGAGQVKLVPTGAVLVSCIGTLGKVGIAGVELATNQQINSIVFDQRKVWPRYGLRAAQLLSPIMEQMAPATTLPIISKSKFEKLQIPLPPLDEQRRIAAILDQADALRRKRREASSTLQKLKSAIFEAEFGDLSEWPTIPFGELAEDTRIGLVRGAAEFGDGLSFPYVRMNAITREGGIDASTIKTTEASDHEVKVYSLNAGDFLFNTRNSKELVGKTAVWRGQPKSLFNNNIMRVRFKKIVEPDFVHAAFATAKLSHELEIRKTGTTSVFAIYWRDLQTLPVPTPPAAKQARFAANIAKIEEQQAHGSIHLAQLAALFASLQRRAFAGEL